MADIKMFPGLKEEREKTIADEQKDRSKYAADEIREIADSVEENLIQSLMIVMLDSDGNISTYETFDDRLGLIGALEFAKNQLS